MVDYDDSLGIGKKTGIIGILTIILVIGVLAVININGIATTIVVMDEIDNKKFVEEMAASYLNKVYEKAQNKYYFDQLGISNIPLVPLTSEFTESGNYSVETEVNVLSEQETEVIITYKRSSDTSFEPPLLVASTVIKNPSPSNDQNYEE